MSAELEKKHEIERLEKELNSYYYLKREQALNSLTKIARSEESAATEKARQALQTFAQSSGDHSLLNAVANEHLVVSGTTANQELAVRLYTAAHKSSYLIYREAAL